MWDIGPFLYGYNWMRGGETWEWEAGCLKQAQDTSLDVRVLGDFWFSQMF